MRVANLHKANLLKLWKVIKICFLFALIHDVLTDSSAATQQNIPIHTPLWELQVLKHHHQSKLKPADNDRRLVLIPPQPTLLFPHFTMFQTVLHDISHPCSFELWQVTNWKSNKITKSVTAETMTRTVCIHLLEALRPPNTVITWRRPSFHIYAAPGFFSSNNLLK